MKAIGTWYFIAWRTRPRRPPPIKAYPSRGAAQIALEQWAEKSCHGPFPVVDIHGVTVCGPYRTRDAAMIGRGALDAMSVKKPKARNVKLTGPRGAPSVQVEVPDSPCSGRGE